MANIIQLRRDTEANWITNNPVLNDGEIGVATSCTELPTVKYKMGDGSAPWNSLAYFNDLSSYTDATQTYASEATNSASSASISATNAAASATNAAASATQASIQADRSASFAGGSLTIAHSHVTGPVAVDPEFTRASAAYDEFLKRYEYNERRWGANGTMVEEGTTNLLPAGAESFLTANGWTNGTGENCTVVDYPIYIEGIGNVIAKRITGNGLGSSINKYYCQIVRTNPHTDTNSCWVMMLSGNATFKQSGQASPVAPSSTMQRLSAYRPGYTDSSNSIVFGTAAPSDVLDIVVYQPQIENKPYATTYTPPGTTRAAETFALPIGAYQKNLLTLNQATGGDTLGNTTGFLAKTSATVSYDATEKWQGMGSIKVVTSNVAIGEGITVESNIPITVGKTYTHTAYIKGSGTISVSDIVIGGYSTPITLTGSWQRVSYTFVARPITEHGILIRTPTQQAATFYIDGLQLEESTTATDWTLPVVDYTNALINPTAFSVEFDYVPMRQPISTYTGLLFDIGTASNNLRCYYQSGGQLVVLSKYNGGTSAATVSGASTYANYGTKYSIKISVSGSTISLWVNGVLVKTGVYNGLTSLVGAYAYFGVAYATEQQANCTFSNVRIRNTSLTDAELAYTGQLTPDQYTTYCSECKESISSRPYVKNNGIADNLVSESQLRGYATPNAMRVKQYIPAGTLLRAVSIATNTIDFYYPLSAKMKAVPALTAGVETTDWKVNSLAGVQTTGFTIALLNAGTNQIGLRLTKTSHGLADAVLQIVTDRTLTA